MEKRTILAVVLSMAVMMVFLMIQDAMNPPQPPVPIHEIAGPAPFVAAENVFPVTIEDPYVDPVPLQQVIVQTERIRVVLSNELGSIVSFQLMNHLDRGQPVEMVLSGDDATQAFTVAFGNLEEVMAGTIRPGQRNFNVRQVTDLIVEFYGNFTTAAGEDFSVIKRYEFKPTEYMFEFTIIMDGGHGISSFDFHGAAYTLIFGPQIGPTFERLDGRHDFRRFVVHRGNGRVRNERVNDRNPTAIVTDQPSWAAIEGKYFILAAMPLSAVYDIGFSIRGERGLSDAARMYITRPAFMGSRLEDRHRFYFGPKNHQNLNRYQNGDNAFNLRDTHLVSLSASRGFLAPLENGLKWLMTFFYNNTVPNYGVAIIFLTILVRIVLFPLTKKASEGTLKMQALAPKIKEIQERNKGNPQKMNSEMAEFYKREGYNPLSGCLPMLAQLPIFLAMFNLFNTSFELRGAMFIPGWIPDLSVPEYVWQAAGGGALPLLGWNALRILPFIYVGSQLLYGKVIQTPDQKGNKMMKYMLYAMPIVFFFVLYDMPSGLLLYWIMSNILTMVQQVIMNKYLARKKALAAAAAPAEPVKAVIAPGGPRKKKRR
ncbi:MAG: membrane protein insertase YidC [Treponema sp.]|jgi:YidC/Oxa1 family membrane protein insertase|nr:membrane protein insertase YidC [Treponema sp.]